MVDPDARRFLALAHEDRLEVDAAKFERTACFNAQQSVEKAIKAVILQDDLLDEQDRDFYTHEIRDLLDIVIKGGRSVPPSVAFSIALTRCAGSIRYGLAGPPVPRSRLPSLVDPVLRWADKIVE